MFYNSKGNVEEWGKALSVTRTPGILQSRELNISFINGASIMLARR